MGFMFHSVLTSNAETEGEEGEQRTGKGTEKIEREEEDRRRGIENDEEKKRIGGKEDKPVAQRQEMVSGTLALL